MSAFPRRRFLGVDFTPLPLDEAVGRIIARDPAAPFAFVVTPNAQHVVAARSGDDRFAGPQGAAWMVLNDSRILRLLSHGLFGFDMPVAPGSDVVARLFERGVPADATLTLIGGDAKVEATLRQRFGIRSVARFTPSFGFWRDPAEVEQCLAFVRAHPARYVFLIAGAPQSEELARRLSATPGVTGVGLCVGSALNFLTGRVRRAPVWMREAGLEWAWRLALNPRGHFRRVFIESAPILWIALIERLRTVRRPA
ncbi:WecB/TagA/CpsF family glycosyltransferase [Brevundimonas sp. NIBR11]|uniref:WecB/TagA/CpsF family glycosyltransferase n=1 Tax=Brevundimonas sp. NIBR11 TaxID=3015999 RepID=UPI0022F0F033|nr:WecB/TagA/CpsF family glycosyltransferase [Brevundimonas sp. NIBR11]WGM31916.1 N-acetylglucosaminyldiphosphoundecaprenol N-acetyl-beta-D-mannosaminyltransferase [Brevundimonas sp. NIBR11]